MLAVLIPFNAIAASLSGQADSQQNYEENDQQHVNNGFFIRLALWTWHLTHWCSSKWCRDEQFKLMAEFLPHKIRWTKTSNQYAA